MTGSSCGQTPSLSTFLKALKTNDIESSIELFINMLKSRQIKNSRPCAIATVHLLLRVVAAERIKDAQTLINRIRSVGRRLVAAQPREMAVGNVVRRILGVVREVAEEDQDGSEKSFTTLTTPTPGDTEQRTQLSMSFSEFSPIRGTTVPENLHTQGLLPASAESNGGGSTSSMDVQQHRPPLPAFGTSFAGQGPSVTSLFNILQHPQGRSPLGTPPIRTSSTALEHDRETKEKLDIKAEVIDGIKELQEELEVVDSQIAESALDHIHSNEIILTHTSSQTVQKFLMTAARKRKFTVVHAEAYPNDHESTYATIVNGGKRGVGDSEDATDERWKPLTSLGITVILIPDSAAFALMSRINKVILAPHTVLANGSLIAAAGAAAISQAAKAHRVPVVVLSGVYKLSPIYPFDSDELIEYGDPGKAVSFSEGEIMDKVDVVNPVYDYVDSELVDLYITNLGGHAPSYLYRIVADHYRVEDIDLSAKSSN